MALLPQIEVEIANGKSTPQACKEAEITFRRTTVGGTSSEASEAAWLNGKERNPKRASYSLLTRTGLLMEGLRAGMEETPVDMSWRLASRRCFSFCQLL